MKRRTTRVAPVEVPRLGPPVNLRPAGAHTDKRRENRAHHKAALRRAAFDVFEPNAIARRARFEARGRARRNDGGFVARSAEIDARSL